MANQLSDGANHEGALREKLSKLADDFLGEMRVGKKREASLYAEVEKRDSKLLRYDEE